MKPGLTVGASAERSMRVASEQGITHMGATVPSVLSTPEMIRLMEQTCRDVLFPYLEENEGTVGFHIDVYHRKAVPVGMGVTASATLMTMDGRRVTFRVEVRTATDVVGDGTVERVIVRKERFAQQAGDPSAA